MSNEAYSTARIALEIIIMGALKFVDVIKAANTKIKKKTLNAIQNWNVAYSSRKLSPATGGLI